MKSRRCVKLGSKVWRWKRVVHTTRVHRNTPGRISAHITMKMKRRPLMTVTLLKKEPMLLILCAQCNTAECFPATQADCVVAVCGEQAALPRPYPAAREPGSRVLDMSPAKETRISSFSFFSIVTSTITTCLKPLNPHECRSSS